MAVALAAGCPFGAVAQHRVVRAPPAWAVPFQLPATSDGATGGLVPPALSLVLPGAGQHVLGQDRKWLYLAVEIGTWAFFAERRHAGGGYRDRYREFAWENARFQSGPRIDGDFAYYETLTHWARSGAFDSDAGAMGVQPELDGTTFNGSVWSLAAQIFGAGTNESDPAYQSALAYYADRAYGPGMSWDWTGSPMAQDQFSDLVDASDSRFRQATTALGVMIANHLISAVDAYISSSAASGARLRLLSAIESGADWGVVLTVPAPR